MPKFKPLSDNDRFPPGGYVPSNKTDVAATFRRKRRELKEAEEARKVVAAEQDVKVRRIKP